MTLTPEQAVELIDKAIAKLKVPLVEGADHIRMLSEISTKLPRGCAEQVTCEKNLAVAQEKYAELQAATQLRIDAMQMAIEALRRPE